jgi:hypothetical protein
MAAQKLFGDIPSGFSGIAGMVSPNITADISQKSEEDDASTLAGYKARLAAQREGQEAAARSQAQWNRQMQLQWGEEDLNRQADQMRQLDAQRKQAFDVMYRPQAESDIRRLQENDRALAAANNQQVMNVMTPSQGELINPTTRARSIPGWGMIGAPLGGPQPGQVQQALNTMYGRTAVAQQAANTNPYYRNPYAGQAVNTNPSARKPYTPL